MRVGIILCILIGMHSCEATRRSAPSLINYVPDSKMLYDSIVRLDSLFFAAYNTCGVNLDSYASFFSEDIEFYHDKGGIMHSKKDIVEATKKNVCGKVTRNLIPGTIEVYPIANFGAVEIGYHTFKNNTEKTSGEPRPGRFVIIWRRQNKSWQITRVISLH